MEGLAVQGTADGVHNAAQQLLAHADIGHAAGALDRGAGADGFVAGQQGGAHAVESQVQGDAVDIVFKLQQLTVFGTAQTCHPDNAVGAGLHGAVVVADHLRLIVPALFLEEGS